MAWGKHEKSIYRKGFFRGLYHEKDKKAVKEMKRRDVDYVVATHYCEYFELKRYRGGLTEGGSCDTISARARRVIG